VAAQAVHALSGRSGAFVAVNCGALPETLVESQLFGHRKGAFSGATEDRPGLVRSAHRGTLFLDEIGDLPLDSQAALLRVLQERQVMPIGATQPVEVDLRLCAATHRPLERLVAQGKFREDLLARLMGYTVQLPSLRERREDLGLITGALLRRVAGERAERVTFAKDAARAIFRHGWPLNIRELEKCLAAAVVLAGDGPIQRDHLPAQLATTATTTSEPKSEPSLEGSNSGIRALSSDDADKRARLVALLTEHGGNISAVARALGKDRVQIRRWLQRFQLDPESFNTRR
jgi:transcriptional regulator with GAF, ATPase, and Fis domain